MGNSLYTDKTVSPEEKAKFGQGLYREVLDTDKLKQNNHSKILAYVVIFTILLGLLIAGFVLYILGKYREFNFIEKEKEESSVATVMACTALGLSALAMLVLWGLYATTYNKILAEDRFVSQLNLISTQGYASSEFNETFSKYIGERFGIKSERTTKTAASELGKILSLGDEYGNHIVSSNVGGKMGHYYNTNDIYNIMNYASRLLVSPDGKNEKEMQDKLEKVTNHLDLMKGYNPENNTPEEQEHYNTYKYKLLNYMSGLQVKINQAKAEAEARKSAGRAFENRIDEEATDTERDTDILPPPSPYLLEATDTDNPPDDRGGIGESSAGRVIPQKKTRKNNRKE